VIELEQRRNEHPAWKTKAMHVPAARWVRRLPQFPADAQCVGSYIPTLSSLSAKESAMNWDRIEGNWKQFTGKVKEQWGKLTDDDIDRMAGQREQLVGKIQENYGVARDEAEQQVDDWSRRLM
jgi:uncharacterized protein YjbJ (UPF0337 family)